MIKYLALCTLLAVGCAESPGDRIDCTTVYDVQPVHYDVVIDRRLPRQLIAAGIQEWQDRSCGLVSVDFIPGNPQPQADVPVGQYHIKACDECEGHKGWTSLTDAFGLKPGAAYSEIHIEQARDSNYTRVSIHEFGHVLVRDGFAPAADPFHHPGGALGAGGDTTLHLHQPELMAFCRMNGGVCATEEL